MDTFTFILEIIGTIAFASSGAMIAIEKKNGNFWRKHFRSDYRRRWRNDA